MKNSWIELTCTVPEGMVDLLADFLVQLSGNGVTTENLSVDTFSIDSIKHSPVSTLKAYFPADAPLEQAIASLQAFLDDNASNFPGFVGQPPTITPIKQEDWANNWKQHFKPSRIGRHLVIKPTWEDFATDAEDIVIELDPGQAFGTGTHPTTRLCLEALEQLLSGQISGTRTAVLDVGTGSGVLSIAAAKLGADPICAIDIDPDAIEVARENLAQNGIGVNVTVSTSPLAVVPGLYQIVVANIIAEELVKLASQLTDKVAAGGHLILSGILTEREPLVREGFAHFSLTEVQITRMEEWSCFIYRLEK